MSFNEKRLAVLGLRGAFGQLLSHHLEQVPDWRIVTADTSTSAGLARLRSLHSDRFVECGIAEQAAVAIATGIALEGIPTFVGSFAPFIVGRAWEQIRLAAYMNAEMTIFGFGAGLGLSYLGYTHCSLEDVSIISSIPNTVIFEPYSPQAILDALGVSLPGKIKYIRITGDGAINRALYSESIERLGSSILLKCEGDARSTIVTAGHTASRLLAMPEVKHSCNIICINHFCLEEMMRIPLDWFAGDIVVVHEAYDPVLFNLIKAALPVNLQSRLRPVHPKKQFSKPGDFDFCAESLDFELRSLE